MAEKELANVIERSLRTMALGALAALDAHFYQSLQLSFVDAVLADPVGAYREALKVMPESMVRTVFRAILRTLRVEAPAVEAALDGLRRGDGSGFARALREAVKEGPRAPRRT